MNSLHFAGSRHRLATLLFGMLSGLALPMLAHAQTQWVQTQRTGNEMRFLYSGRIERYDLGTQSWMDTVTLSRTGATSFTGDGTGAFVAYGTTIYRYAPDFTGGTATGSTASSSISSLFLDGQLLLAVHSATTEGRVTIFNRTTGAQTGSRAYRNASFNGASLAPGLNKIFGRLTSGLGNVLMAGYSEDGIPGAVMDSRDTNGVFGNPKQVFVFPDESRFAGTTGAVYSTADLSFKGYLSVPVTAIGWNGGRPVVFSGTNLVDYTPELIETGRATVPAGGTALAVNAAQAFIFTPASPKPGVRMVPLSDIKAPEPGSAVDPQGLVFTPDDAFADASGNLVLLSRLNKSLFRWSPSTRSWLAPISLVGTPDAVAFSAAGNAIYTAYPNLVLRKINASDPMTGETVLNRLPERAIGLAATGDLLFAAGSQSGSIFSATGAMIGDLNMFTVTGRWNTWDPVRRRMYHYMDNEGLDRNNLMFDVIGADGRVTLSEEMSWEEGPFEFSPPIRVSPDGDLVVTGGGVVFTADTRFRGSLPSAVKDVLWQGQKAFTLRALDGRSQVQSWPAGLVQPDGRELKMDGTPFRLFPAGAGNLAAVTLVNGIPRFAVYDASLNPVYISPANPTPPGVLVAVARTTGSVSLSWEDRSDNEDGQRIEYRAAGSDGAWVTGAAADKNAITGTVTGLPPGKAFDFRVVAFNGTLESASGILKSGTLGSPDEPVGEPYGLAVSRIYRTSISLSWRDNAANETGFRILRSSAPAGDAVIMNVPAGVTDFTDTGLSAGTVYYYRIQVVNGALAGDLSDPVNARTLAMEALPAAPSLLAWSGLAFTEVTLAWRDNSLNEDGFLIETSLSSADNPIWTERARTSFSATGVRLTGLTPNTGYNVRVKAFNSRGASAAISTQFTTPKEGGDYAGLSMRSGNIQYFLFKGPTRIERYDLSGRAWLAAIPAQAEITALWADDSGIFAAEGPAIVRWGLDGGGRTVLRAAETPVTVLFTTGGVLGYVRQDNPDSRIITLNRSSGAFLATIPFSGAINRASADPVTGRIFLGGMYALTFMDISPAGTLLRKGSNQIGSGIVYVFPSTGRLAMPGGGVFSKEDLALIDNFSADFHDMAFYGGDVPVTLKWNELRAYSSTLAVAGTATIDSYEGKVLAVQGTDALVFLADGTDAHGMALRTVPLSRLNAPQPDQPLDPNGLAYNADDLFVDSGGVIQVYSRARQSLLPWSPALRAYQAPVPLAGGPGLVSYSSGSSTLLTKYGTSDIRRMKLPSATPLEAPLVTVPEEVTALVAAGEFAYVNSYHHCRTFLPDGTLLTDLDNFPPGGGTHAWDPVRRRVYHLQDGAGPVAPGYETLGADGRITASGNGSQQEHILRDSPIRISPDGNFIFIGPTGLYKADDLSLSAKLPDPVKDADWRGQSLATIQAVDSQTRLRTWSGGGLLPGPEAGPFPGTPLRVFSTPQGLTVVTFLAGAPHFTLLGENLETLFSSPWHPTAPGGLEVTDRSANSISLKWTDLSENEDQFMVDCRTAGAAEEWTERGAFPAGATSGAVTGLPSGTALEFRVRAVDDMLSSPPSAVASASTLDGGDQPAGEPYNLTVTRVFHNSVTLSWRDNASNETGFLISRSTNPAGPAETLMAPADAVTFTDSGRAAGITYYYRIQAVNGSADGELSAQVSATTLGAAAVPAAPTEVGGVDFTGTSFIIEWKDNSLNEDGFIIEYRRTGSGAYTEAGRVDFNRTQFTVTGLSPMASYIFRVRSINATGSKSSALLELTMPADGGEFLNMAQRVGDIYYFAFSGPDRIERYDLAGRAWLAPIPAEAKLTALWPDGGMIYASEDRKVIRWNADGGGRTVLLTAEQPARPMAILGNLLLYQQWIDNAARWTSVDKNSGVVLATFQVANGNSFIAVDEAGKRLFTNTPYGPSSISIAPDGTLLQENSPQDNSQWSTDRLILFPGNDRVLSAVTGRVYSTASLKPLDTLLPSITDMVFPEGRADAPLTLRDNSLIPLNRDLQETTPYSLETINALRLAVQGTDALVFFPDGTNFHGLSVKTVPLSALNIPDPDKTPLISGTIPDITAGTLTADAVVDFSYLITDPATAGRLVWRVVSASTPALFSRLEFDAGGRLIIQYFSRATGKSTVTIEVSDGSGAVVRKTFNVKIPELIGLSLTFSDTLTKNPATGLWEQPVTVRNRGFETIGGFEIAVSELPSAASLYNAGDSMNGYAMIGYYQPLAVNASVTVVLEYYAPTLAELKPRLGVGAVRPYADQITSGSLGIASAAMVRPKAFQMVFATVPGELYIVQYQDGGAGEWRDSLVRIRAAGSQMQWTDRGAPRTPSAPGTGKSRFYRVKRL
ncbi:MAG: hypothetical protein JWM59_564 [Verrucomicrobiales bacterium]|nr:hypothetical protein [Verrucomicrobiales bacterium]